MASCENGQFSPWNDHQGTQFHKLKEQNVISKLNQFHVVKHFDCATKARKKKGVLYLTNISMHSDKHIIPVVHSYPTTFPLHEVHAEFGSPPTASHHWSPLTIPVPPGSTSLKWRAVLSMHGEPPTAMRWRTMRFSVHHVPFPLHHALVIIFVWLIVGI